MSCFSAFLTLQRAFFVPMTEWLQWPYRLIDVYHVTMLSLNLSLTVHYFCTKIGSFTWGISIKIVLKLFFCAHFPFFEILYFNSLLYLMLLTLLHIETWKESRGHESCGAGLHGYVWWWGWSLLVVCQIYEMSGPISCPIR